MGEQIKSEIYHERQRLQFCLLHALNNLFQEKDAFSRVDLNGIAEELNLDDPTPVKWNPISVVFKPHHNLFTGNYDVNVLIAALERRGKNVVWHDRRNGAGSIASLEGSEDGLMGIVLNIPVRRYGGLLKNRHWLTLRKIGGIWYNLDSDLKAPTPFEDVDDVRVFLDSVILAGGEILLVMNDNK
ncbi:hypothetical protein SOVF_029290 [Spinacia oleracea]|uniref:ubiquitinyl hydrolase 1 n=1 Tax=Spinacia oleracea TaxID=3562 RepID=A0A9R0JAH3_SPIOL|nr:josephin-like protein [Spinacia oleracea]KNA22938.1 hypothetical protein SOVF_029290 [Spinacia oleracea]